MKQQYELGQFIRRRYDAYIGPKYSPDKVYIQSSDSDRALTSAQCNAAGMFPPTGNEIWNKQFLWQPIPIHGDVPMNEDNILYPGADCPRADRLVQNYVNSTKFKSEMNRYKSLFQLLENKIGKPFNITDITNFYDTAYVEKIKGLA